MESVTEYHLKIYCCMHLDCKKEYKTKQNLKRHVMISHFLAKKATCTFCNKTFLNEINLKEHYLIHTGSKPYKCPTCGKRFRHKSRFGFHKREHLQI